MNINETGTGMQALKNVVTPVENGRYQEYFWALAALIAYDLRSDVGEGIMRMVHDEEKVHDHFLRGDSALTAYKSFV